MINLPLHAGGIDVAFGILIQLAGGGAQVIADFRAGLAPVMQKSQQETGLR
jgi:hypothetical protein